MQADRRPPKSIDEYIAAFAPDVQRVLKRVRSAIRKAVPGAEEAISYGIPTYKTRGRPVIYFAGWKQHYSLYPSTKELVAAFKDALAPTRSTTRAPSASHSSRPSP